VTARAARNDDAKTIFAGCDLAGFLYADRTPKFPFESIAEATGIVPEIRDAGASTPDNTRMKARMALPDPNPNGPEESEAIPSASLPPSGSSR